MLVEASRSAGKSIYGVDCADQLPNGAYTDALMIALSQNSVLTANYLISVMSPAVLAKIQYSVIMNVGSLQRFI
jgi:hypothetical protein